MTKKIDVKDWGVIKRKRYNVMLKEGSTWSYLDELETYNLIEELGSIGIGNGRSSSIIRFKQQFTKEHFIKLEKHYYISPSEL